MININKTTTSEKLMIGIGLGLFLLGLFSWGKILAGGAEATGLTDMTPWGLFIALFLFLESVGAGAIFFGALYRNKTLLSIGVASVIGAGVSIMPDLGTPLAAWKLFLTPNVNAPMVLDVWFVGLNCIFGGLLLLAIHNKNDNLAKSVRPIVLIVAILLPLGTAWMMTTMIGMPGWNSNLEMFSFLLASAMAGSLIFYIIDKEKAKNIVITTLAATLIIPIAELGHSMYGTSSSLESEAFHAMINQYGTLFFGNVLLFVALPLILVLKNQKPLFVTVLGLVGILIGKYILILQGSILPYLRIGKYDIPGMLEFKEYAVNNYVPTANEWIVAIGMLGFTVALAVILFSLVKEEKKALN